MKQHIWIPTLLAILAITAGCGSHGYSRADRAADSVQNAAARVDLGASQMAVALATLSDLLEADVAKLQQTLAYTLARADAFVAYHKLLQSAGLLNAEFK